MEKIEEPPDCELHKKKCKQFCKNADCMKPICLKCFPEHKAHSRDIIKWEEF